VKSQLNQISKIQFLLKLENLAMFLLFFALLFHQLDNKWWLALLLLFTPDVGMIGYIINPKVGAYTYNFLHNMVVSVILLAVGHFVKQDILIVIAFVMLAHLFFDRFMGYGLKYTDSFKNTHLGAIGGKERESE